MNWRLKIAAKLVLSRLPINTLTWQRLGLFRAGDKDSYESASHSFAKHLEAGGIDNLQSKTVLELGPGNGLLTPEMAHAKGAYHTWLIDADQLAKEPSVKFGTYLTDGLKSLRTVPASSVDFIFSTAVLEHVRLHEFEEVIRETTRILKPSGVASHQIDFRDHLQEALNNLRFSKKLWEGRLFADSGFYTNRIPWPSMRRIFEDCGLSVVKIVSQHKWDTLPTPQSSMAEQFRILPAEDLECWSIHVVLQVR